MLGAQTQVQGWLALLGWSHTLVRLCWVSLSTILVYVSWETGVSKTANWSLGSAAWGLEIWVFLSPSNRPSPRYTRGSALASNLFPERKTPRCLPKIEKAIRQNVAC